MTAKEVELILIEGLLHTPETRIDFYLSKAKKNNCSPVNFCLALGQAYDRLDKYVNSFEFRAWSKDEDTGKRIYSKKTINLFDVTKGQIRGYLDSQNIIELAYTLKEMTLQLIPKDEAEKPAKAGFQSSLTDLQVQTLFELLKGKYIDTNTKPDHFKAIFRTIPLPPDLSLSKELSSLQALYWLIL